MKREAPPTRERLEVLGATSLTSAPRFAEPRRKRDRRLDVAARPDASTQILNPYPSAERAAPLPSDP